MRWITFLSKYSCHNVLLRNLSSCVQVDATHLDPPSIPELPQCKPVRVDATQDRKSPGALEKKRKAPKVPALQNPPTGPILPQTTPKTSIYPLS